MYEGMQSFCAKMSRSGKTCYKKAELSWSQDLCLHETVLRFNSETWLWENNIAKGDFQSGVMKTEVFHLGTSLKFGFINFSKVFIFPGPHYAPL